jgi:peptidyl-dipeptidase Dcp
MMFNPLLQHWNTLYETPPFHLIEPAHFEPAVKQAIRAAKQEISVITENPETPSFRNSVAALENSGKQLARISSVLFNLNIAETTKELQGVAQEVTTSLTRFSNDVTLNRKLFTRIRAIYEDRYSLDLDTEQIILVEKRYISFLLGGASLENNKRKKYRIISEELSKLSLKFEENVLDETNAFQMHLTDPGDLAGLPSTVVEMASMIAKSLGMEGWVFTLHMPSYGPFMQYSDRRDLREKMFRAFNTRAFHNDEKDNRSLVKRITELRLELARMLGFNSYADVALTDRMAETPEKVCAFLEELFAFSHPAATRDYDDLKKFALECGHTSSLERWDWPYYSEKLKKIRYNIDDEILKPYLKLENVREAIFALASRLFGLRFVRNRMIPVYHHEVEVWEVFDLNDKFISVLYTDFHPRKGKAGGAWMTSYRDQWKDGERDVRPLISIVTNFSRPTESTPSLLTFNEFTTFLHEFGHALHGMLSDCTYESLSCTNVARDFVELPSQFMENFAFEPEWLDSWAAHYETGAKIPHEIIEMIRAASVFNEGYACNRQLGFGFLDMAWHTITSPVEKEISEFESEILSKSEILPAVENISASCSFTHLFSGGYAAGYYGYKWAEVLEADAFNYFKETSIFDKETAESFKKNILERGGSDKPSVLYRNFRGKEPTIDAFLERSGLR